MRVRAWAVLGSAAVAGSVGGVALERWRAPKDPAPLSEDALSKVVPPAPPQRPHRPSLASAAALTGLPPYPGARPQDLAPEMQAHGVPMHVAWFSTGDAPEDVIHYYEEKLRDDRKMVVSHLYSEKAGYVGYLDLPSKELHLISVLQEGDETLVFPSSAEMGNLGQGGLPETLPRVTGAEGDLVLSFRDNGVLQDSVFQTVKSQSLEAVLAQYQKGFEEKGWKVLPPARTAQDAVRLEARRDRTTATVILRKLSDSATPGVAIYVTLTTA